MEELTFPANWDDKSKANQGIILSKLGISDPSDSSVLQVYLSGDYFEVEFKACDGKYWTMAFLELVFDYLDLEFGKEIEVSDELEQLTASCFSGVGPHFGYVDALKDANYIQVEKRG